MKKLYLMLIFGLSSLLFMGCEQDANVVPPAFVKRPFIMCLMTMRSPEIKASVAYTKPYYGEIQDEFEWEEHAVLVLKDISANLEDTFVSLSGGQYSLYPVKVKLKEENTYRLTVYLPDGTVHTAESTIPPKAKIENLKATFLEIGKPYLESENSGSGWAYYLNPLTVELTYSGIKDGYFVSPHLEALTYNDSGDNMQVELYFKEPIKLVENEVVKFLHRSEFYSFNPKAPFKINEFFGSVYTMDKAYKNFYISQFQMDGDPFQEPTTFLSNFSAGALGVFGSYDFDQGTVLYP
jgi:hypothetical protein